MEGPIEKEIEKFEEYCSHPLQVYPDNAIRIQIIHTRTKQGELVIRFPENYPKAALFVDFKSTTLPPKLVELLKKKLESNLEKLAEEGKEQVKSCFDFINTILENNNLIPAWIEVNQSKQLMTEKDTFKPLEKPGKLKIKLVEGDFYSEFEFVIPKEYPQEPPLLNLIDSNFDPVFTTIFYNQAQDMIRVLHRGGKPFYLEKSDKNEGIIGNVQRKTKLEQDFEKMKILSREEVKHDLDYLKMQSELKGMQDDKQMRKQMKFNAKKEAKYEKALADKMALIDQVSNPNYCPNANPSLFYAIDYLANYFVRFLPTAKCQGCQQKLLVKLKSDKDPKKPEMTYCGHWFHTECLSDFLNSPPFKRPCPTCGDIVGNSKFPCDENSIKNREKAWTQMQARQAEKDELEDLLGLS